MKNPEIDNLGNKYWCNDEGEYHREDGPAIEYREDGLAIEWSDGSKFWYINGKRHREDGPAIEWNGGDKEWWYNDECIGVSWQGFTKEDFERYLKIKEYW